LTSLTRSKTMLNLFIGRSKRSTCAHVSVESIYVKGIDLLEETDGY